MNLTADQLRAVETEGVDICVVAGAGTGKTRVLTDRVVHRVSRRGTDLRRVLAITFTERAAAEMKHRLADSLVRAGRPGAREEVDAAAISTIHAFCARLLREFAIEAGVDPQFRVLDEVASGARRRDAVTAFVGETHQRDRDLFDVLARLPGSDPAETVLDVWERARASGRKLEEFVAAPTGMPPRSEFLASLREDVAEARAAAASSTRATQEKAQSAAAALAAFPRESAPAETLAAAVGALAESFSLNVAAAVKPWLANVRATCEALLEVLAEEAILPLRAHLAAALPRLEDLYAERKGRGAELDFVDLEREAVQLLEGHPAVRAAVRERWSEVLVDEFQDVNPLQARLVELVRAPSALFVVGDPKQSIYGFRGSAVEVFDECRKRVASSDARGEVTLAASFRSRPEILAVVNHVFAEDFPLGAPLAAARAFAPRTGPCAELFVVRAPDAAEGRAAEAAWIARRIVELVEGPQALLLAEPTEEDPLATRRAGFGDVAVLLHVTTDVKLLERALTAQDVPYGVLKGRGFFEAGEVVDLANLLAVVDNPEDDLTLASVLRSPACGVTDDGLFVLCRARGGTRALADVLDAPTPSGLPKRDRAALARFVAAWRELRALRSCEPLSVLVDRTLEVTRLETLALAQVNGRQRAANLRKVRALARAADADASTGRADLRAFLRSVRDLREREVRETEAPASRGADGAVSLLTVHAAKGLEFPVVFVPDLSRGQMSERSSVVSHAQDGLGLRGVFESGPLAEVTPWGFRRVRDRNEERELSEEDRLLYVAMTRAEEHLVLSTSLTSRTDADGARSAWWGRIARAVGPDLDAREPSVRPPGVLVHPQAEAAPQGRAATHTLLHRVAHELVHGRLPPLDISPEAAADADRLLAEASREIPVADGTLYATTVSALVAFARCPQEFRLRHVIGAPESLATMRESVEEQAPVSDAPRPGEDDEWGAPLSARALGRAAHLALEHLVPEFDGDFVAEARAALAAEARGAAPSPVDVERVAAWIQGFATSDLGREVSALPRDHVRREQALLFPVAPGARTVVRGQMDLVYRGADGWVVVDYKAGAAAFTDDAIRQMQLYALGLESITGEAPARLVLFSLPESRAIDVPCARADVEALRAGLVAEFVAKTRKSDFAPLAAPPCASCAYRRRCAFSRAETTGQAEALTPSR